MKIIVESSSGENKDPHHGGKSSVCGVRHLHPCKTTGYRRADGVHMTLVFNTLINVGVLILILVSLGKQEIHLIV